jgi:hypothetical protein
MVFDGIQPFKGKTVTIASNRITLKLISFPRDSIISTYKPRCKVLSIIISTWKIRIWTIIVSKIGILNIIVKTRKVLPDNKAPFGYYNNMYISSVPSNATRLISNIKYKLMIK